MSRRSSLGAYSITSNIAIGSGQRSEASADERRSLLGDGDDDGDPLQPALQSLDRAVSGDARLVIPCYPASDVERVEREEAAVAGGGLQLELRVDDDDDDAAQRERFPNQQAREFQFIGKFYLTTCIMHDFGEPGQVKFMNFTENSEFLII